MLEVKHPSPIPLRIALPITLDQMPYLDRRLECFSPMYPPPFIRPWLDNCLVIFFFFIIYYSVQLGEIFSDMVDLKRERWVKQPSNKHFASKVNTLVNQAILYFQVALQCIIFYKKSSSSPLDKHLLISPFFRNSFWRLKSSLIGD